MCWEFEVRHLPFGGITTTHSQGETVRGEQSTCSFMAYSVTMNDPKLGKLHEKHISAS